MSDNSQVQTIYLSKDGTTSGPFEPAQIEEMKRSGEFYRYELHWDNTMTEWAKVPSAPTPPPVPEKKIQAPAPPPLPSRPAAPAIPERPTAAAMNAPVPTPAPAAVSAPAPQPAPAATAPITHPADYPAICHDYKRTQGGLATQITSQGCTLVCSDQETPPPFGKDARIWADLFDEKSDRSLTTRAMVKDLRFDGKSWKIQLIWENPPKF